MPHVDHKGYWSGVGRNIKTGVKNFVPTAIRGGLGIAGAVAGAYLGAHVGAPHIGTKLGGTLGAAAGGAAGSYLGGKISDAVLPKGNSSITGMIRSQYKSEKHGIHPGYGAPSRTPTRTPAEMNPRGATIERF
jgi:hypothetical protein